MRNNIKQYLDKIITDNYTVDDLVRDSGIGRTSLFEIARGKQIPKLNTAIKIARALKVPIYDVFPEIKEVVWMTIKIKKDRHGRLIVIKTNEDKIKNQHLNHTLTMKGAIV